MNQKQKRSTLIIIILFFTFLYQVFFANTPDFDREQILTVPQSSIITDHEGNELFRFFDEDRRRIDYESISPYMIDAIVNTEDQTFRTNNGVDNKAIIRALINNISKYFGQASPLQGASTITQQLVKNIFLTNKKTLKRKVQETILAKKLTRHEINLAKQSTETKEEAQKVAKESILSMYLNFVFFGNQAYGIESAAQNYFKKSASDLTLIESSILSSLPQAPSLYNPVLDTKRVLGHRYVISGSSHMITETVDKSPMMNSLYASLPEFSGVKSPETCLDDIASRGQHTWSTGKNTYFAYYQPGRKDYVLCQLYNGTYITELQLQEAWLAAKDITIHQAVLPIQVPHFVFWIKQRALELSQLQDRGITAGTLLRQGYTIQTTLNQEYQKLAQGAVSNYMGLLKKNGGNNRALLHIDSSNGDILSYIGSHDFYSVKSEGQNDIIQAIKQVGSTIKPFFYAYLFTNYDQKITSPVGDYPIPGGPSNHDSIFRGNTSLAHALGGSRNLPVVRLFRAMGGDKTFIPYLKRLGFNQLKNNHDYNYPLALGAGEHTILELAGAYAQLSTTGERYHPINPITKITDPQGNVVYERDIHQTQNKKEIPSQVGQMIREILSDQNYMPAGWWPRRLISMENFALKTGTSDKKIGKKSYPRDGWMVFYTPQDVVVSWAGNTNGSAMGSHAYGGEMNYYVVKQYIQSLQGKGLIKDAPRVDNGELPLRQDLNNQQRHMLRGG